MVVSVKGNLKSSAGRMADKGKATHPISAVPLVDALKAFSGHAVVASEALVDMCISGALVYLLGYWCKAEPRTKMEVIAEKLADALKAANPTKAESTMRGYLATCKALYNHIVDPDHARQFAGTIQAVAESNTTTAAQAVLAEYLKGKGVTGLDKLKEFCGLQGSNSSGKTATPGDKMVASLKSLGTSIQEDKAKPAAMATVIANSLPAEIKPAMMATAAIKRIVNPDDATKAAHDAAMHLAHVDLEAFDKFVVGLVKTRDAMLEAAPKDKGHAKPKGKGKTTKEAVVPAS